MRELLTGLGRACLLLAVLPAQPQPRRWSTVPVSSTSDPASWRFASASHPRRLRSQFRLCSQHPLGVLLQDLVRVALRVRLLSGSLCSTWLLSRDRNRVGSAPRFCAARLLCYDRLVLASEPDCFRDGGPKSDVQGRSPTCATYYTYQLTKSILIWKVFFQVAKTDRWQGALLRVWLWVTWTGRACSQIAHGHSMSLVAIADCYSRNVSAGVSVWLHLTCAPCPSSSCGSNTTVTRSGTPC